MLILVRDRALDKKVVLGDSLIMGSGGGTQLWCPKCDAIHECKVLSYDNTLKGNFSHTEFPDLNWRERPRECNNCGDQFDTYEIERSAIDELVELRKLVQGIKSSIEEQQKDPTSLLKLLKSLKDD